MFRSACSLLGLAIAAAAAELAQTGSEPIHELDPIVVTAVPLPLVKLDLDYHLRTARFGAAAVAAGDFIYVIGGSNNSGNTLDDIERFDPRTGHSEAFARLNIARRNHRAVLDQGKIYVLGGFNGTHFRTSNIFESSVEVLDLATGAVTAAPPMPVAKAGFACAISGRKLFVLGGARERNNNVVTTNSAEAFDLFSGTWAKSLTMPTPRMSMAVNVYGFIIVPGGYYGHREVANVEVFNPRDNLWRILPPLHKPVSANSLVYLDHYLFLFGRRELTVYELRQKQSESFSFDYKAASDTAIAVHNGKIYVIGGSHDTGISMEDFFAQDYAFPSIMPLGPGEAPNINAFPTHDRDQTKSATGLTDYGAIDDIQVFELRHFVQHDAKQVP